MGSRRKVRVTARVLEQGDDHGECPFCRGRDAAYEGLARTDNPFPLTEYPDGSAAKYTDDHWLWSEGYSLGAWETR